MMLTAAYRMPEFSGRTNACAFRTVSPCRDFVSPMVCNEHAKLFNIIYVNISTKTTAATCRQIVAYMRNHPVKLPLFRDQNGSVCAADIYTFANTVTSEHPGINRESLIGILSQLVGVSLNVPPTEQLACGWINDRHTKVYVMDHGKPAMCLAQLPILHQLLLAYSLPSISVNSGTGEYTAEPPSLALECDPTTGKLAFVTQTPQCALLWVDEPNCVARHITVSALRMTGSTENVVTIHRMSTGQFC